MKTLLLFICTFLHLCRSPAPIQQQQATRIVPSPTPTPTATITVDGATYAYAFFTVDDDTNVSLIPNFRAQEGSEQLLADNDCRALVNGGFYDTNHNPLGYFVHDKKTIGAQIDSALVNGFIWKGMGTPTVISSDIPHEDFQFALQTGPMLLFDRAALSLSIHNDTGARRMVAARGDQLVFLTIFNPDAVFDGPLLGDLPRIVLAISDKETLGISEAVNLDGGSASAFISQTRSLSELTVVGSIFCISN